MLCPRCRTMNAVGQPRCVRCGTPLAYPQPMAQPAQQIMPPRRTGFPAWGYVMFGMIALLAVLFFILILALVARPSQMPITATPSTRAPAANVPSATAIPKPTDPLPTVTPIPPSVAPPATVAPSATLVPPTAMWTPTPTATPSPTATPTPTFTPIPPTPTSPPVGLNVGRTAPNFTLKDSSGNMVSLNNFRGKPVLINFWASWCGWCRNEMADLNALYVESQSKDLVVLGVNTDESDRAAAVGLIKEKKLTFPIVWDESNAVNHQYDVKAFPTSFFIDRYGVIRYVNVGSMNRDTMNAKAVLIF